MKRFLFFCVLMVAAYFAWQSYAELFRVFGFPATVIVLLLAVGFAAAEDRIEEERRHAELRQRLQDFEASGPYPASEVRQAVASYLQAPSGGSSDRQSRQPPAERG